MMMQQVFPHINFRREVTVGHLLLDFDSPAGPHAKVNPPIRFTRGRGLSMGSRARSQSRLDCQ